MSLKHTSIESVLGPIRIAAEKGKLIGLWFRGQRYEPALTDAEASLDADPVLRAAADWVATLLATGKDAPRPPLAPRGTPFQQRVWSALLDIPAGSSLSYTALARTVGAPRSVRAVAAAVGRNPISLLIPCHRVVGSDGALTGYAGGLGRKQALLARERGEGWPLRAVASAYRTQYRDPIAVDAGESVRFVARVDDGEFPGWRWAEHAGGKAGWVPEAWFRVDGDRGVARRRYCARELDVSPGDRVLVLDEFGGWAWGRREGEAPGWVPLTALARSRPTTSNARSP